jgi:hypothetical protein
MNSKKLKTAAQLLIVVCIMALASCSKGDKIEYVWIKVTDMHFENVSASGKASVDDTVSVYLSGSIGPTQCYVFDGISFPYEFKDGVYTVVIEAWGIKENKDYCEPRESRLDDIEHKLTFRDQYEQPMPGTYIFYDHSNLNKELGRIEIIE